jgi:hypothetical protein
MAEIRTVTTLRHKRDEVRRSIKLYEKRLDQARADLAHLSAAIAIFESKNGDLTLPAYADMRRLFRYGEAFKLCTAALASGPMTTKELAVYVAQAKGLDAKDTVMRRTMARHLIHSLRLRAKQGQLEIEGKRKGTIVWRLPGALI